MPEKKKLVRKIDNDFDNPIVCSGTDCSAHVFEQFHLEREGNGIKIVSDGLVDVQKEIDSQACNAGLVNIMKMQELRYGTLENAIKRNEAKQVYADVSKVPMTVGEQAEYVAKAEKEVLDLCNKLGISKEDLLKMNVESLGKLFEAKQVVPAPDSNEGGDK